MFNNPKEIEAAFGVETETAYLDFKRGAALLDVRKAGKSEFIKDVTGLSNAGGGFLVYGVSTRSENGATVASGFDLVPSGAVTEDQLTQIIHANTAPPLTGFDIHTVAVNQGLVIVIEVAEGDTATQNRLDHRFYQRVAATTGVMEGYAVRDVMNRRRVPRLEATVRAVRNVAICRIHAGLRNVGSVSAEHWRFVLEIPLPWSLVQSTTWSSTLRVQRANCIHDGLEYTRWELSSERMPPTTTSRLLPEEQIEFTFGASFPDTMIDVASRDASREIAVRPPVRWVLYVDNAAPIRGAIPFEEWFGPT